MNLGNIEHTHDHTTEEKVRGLIDQLDAYIAQFHGGRVEFVSLEGDTLKVRMGGACEKCPLQPKTLRPRDSEPKTPQVPKRNPPKTRYTLKEYQPN